MIEGRCQQATQKTNLVRILVQTEEESHVKRSEKPGLRCGQGLAETFRKIVREHTCCSSVLGEMLFNGYCGHLIINSVYRLEKTECNYFWALYCISEVLLLLQVSWPSWRSVSV